VGQPVGEAGESDAPEVRRKLGDGRCRVGAERLQVRHVDPAGVPPEVDVPGRDPPVRVGEREGEERGPRAGEPGARKPPPDARKRPRRDDEREDPAEPERECLREQPEPRQAEGLLVEEEPAQRREEDDDRERAEDGDEHAEKEPLRARPRLGHQQGAGDDPERERRCGEELPEPSPRVLGDVSPAVRRTWS
jgi:hypothetical protein